MSYEELERKIEENANKIISNFELINNNSERIQQNTGALEILKTFKADSKKFFIMWIITFIALLVMVGYTIYLTNDTNTITTQEVEQESSEGSNYYVGRDGDIG